MFSIHSKLNKRFFPKTLSNRFILIIIIPILIGQMVAVYLFYQRHWYNVINHNSGFIATEINALINSELYLEKNSSYGEYFNLEYQFIRDAEIPQEADNLDKTMFIFKNSLENQIDKNNSIVFENVNKIYAYIQLADGVLIIHLPYKLLFNPTTYVFVLWVIFLTTLLLSVSLIFSKNQIRSIIELTEAAEEYGKGKKQVDYKPSGATEIRKAGIAFLKMRDRLEKDNAKRSKMLAMISHDLKTPLTRMKLQVAMMEDNEEKEELESDINSMQQMIQSYLDFVRGESGEEFEKIDLSTWLKEIIKKKWPSDKYNIEINIKNSPIISNIQLHSFSRAISNIISNALKYATKIEISISIKNEKALITIEDNGSGIPESDRKRVFKPFYRVDKSRSLDNIGSVGLGLAISKEIINGHFGTISLEDSKKLKGLLVKIKLPIKS